MKYKIFKFFFVFFLLITSLSLPACNSRESEKFLNNNENDVQTKESINEQSVLIVYFSTSGVTKKVAENMADILTSDIYEIVPKSPYTEEDLTYYTNGRADLEQGDATSRPEIAGDKINMDKYRIIFIGYPIWHGEAPRIISTFLESYDFHNKIIIPFCTSHSSGIGSSEKSLQGLTPDSITWLEGRRFDNTTEKSEIEEWLMESELLK